jgi:hypothetical protein
MIDISIKSKVLWDDPYKRSCRPLRCIEMQEMLNCPKNLHLLCHQNIVIFVLVTVWSMTSSLRYRFTVFCHLPRRVRHWPEGCGVLWSRTGPGGGPAGTPVRCAPTTGQLLPLFSNQSISCTLWDHVAPVSGPDFENPFDQLDFWRKQLESTRYGGHLFFLRMRGQKDKKYGFIQHKCILTVTVLPTSAFLFSKKFLWCG